MGLNYNLQYWGNRLSEKSKCFLTLMLIFVILKFYYRFFATSWSCKLKTKIQVTNSNNNCILILLNVIGNNNQ